MSIAHPLEHVHAATFGDNDAGAVGVKGARGFGRIVVPGQGALGLEAGEDAERVNAFRDTAGHGYVALAEQEHLGSLDDPSVAGGTGGADRIVRAGDA